MSNVSEEHEEVFDRIEEIEMEMAFLDGLAFLLRDKFQNDPTVNPDYLKAIDIYAFNRNYKLNQELESLKVREKFLYDRMMTED